MAWNLAIERAIAKVIEDIGDPLMCHIQSRIGVAHPGIWTCDEISDAVMVMVNDGRLRMKEDSVDHDWSYRKGRNWKGDNQ